MIAMTMTIYVKSILAFTLLQSQDHEAENLNFFLLYYHFPMDDSSESVARKVDCQTDKQTWAD